VSGVPEDVNDPSSNTQAFQAWVNQTQPAEPARSKTPMVIGIVIAVVIVLALLLWLALG
jgi:antibiotic biosynthesis monooxygenase (ABM) superfamily enzyme